MNFTTVMYHYVRKVNESNFPNLKALEIEKFKNQLDYFKSNYNMISSKELYEFKFFNKPLPSNACLLTFDDGYKDHIEYVLPELLKRNIQGIFFPVVSSVLDRILLDVNKIQFILEKNFNYEKLIKEINSLCLEFGLDKSILKNAWDSFGKPNRYDPGEINYIKKLLQHLIPEKIRKDICDIMFKKYVSSDMKSFADSLYLSHSDVKELLNSGMEIGSHSVNHFWLNKLSIQNQQKEILPSKSFLKNLGVDTNRWMMCYPYGSYNKETMQILEKENCAFAFTAKVGFSELINKDFLELSRFDTNDFSTV